MNHKVFRSETRGHANHGWLETYHSFSFANYYNAERLNFGALRVLNDDTVAPSGGFGTHQHRNMEIVSIPLSGRLRHRDSMENETVISADEVQIMSAGSGVYHSEYNHSTNDEVSFLQIWVFPRVTGTIPRYDQKKFPEERRRNVFQEIVSPDSASGGVRINQDCWFHRIDMDAQTEQQYDLRLASNGLHLFVLEGNIEVLGERLFRRDAIEVQDDPSIKILSITPSELLLIEVPFYPA